MEDGKLANWRVGEYRNGEMARSEIAKENGGRRPDANPF
jgi:hypothetical protein